MDKRRVRGTGVHWDGMPPGIRVIEFFTGEEMKFKICCNMYCKCMIIYVVIVQNVVFKKQFLKLKSILLMAPAESSKVSDNQYYVYAIICK